MMPRQARPGFTLMEAITAVTVVVLIGGVVGALFMASTRVWERCSTQAKAFPSGYIALSRIAKDIRDAGNIYTAPLNPPPVRWETGKSYAEGDHVTDQEGLIFRCITGHTATSVEPRREPARWAPVRSYIVIYRPVPKIDLSTGNPATLTFTAGGVSKTVTPNQTPLQIDTERVRVYYLSDETGDFGKASGNLLWCMIFDQEFYSGEVTEVSRQIICRGVQSLAFKVDKYTSTGRPVWISSLTLEVEGRVDGKEHNERYRRFETKFSTGISFKNPSVSALPTEPDL